MLKDRCKKCGRWKGNNHRCPKVNPMKGKKRRFGDGHWKGGKTKTSGGYVWIKSLYHPFADHQGYMLEHRLIMEKQIKRFLLPSEVVHHINGIRDDNRIENLQLLQGLGEHNRIHKIYLSSPRTKPRKVKSKTLK